jgi:hypothetical protein
MPDKFVQVPQEALWPLREKALALHVEKCLAGDDAGGAGEEAARVERVAQLVEAAHGPQLVVRLLLETAMLKRQLQAVHSRLDRRSGRPPHQKRRTLH